MNGLLGTFVLRNFDKFFNNYKSENNLANEVLTALNHVLSALNEFFDLCEGLTNAQNCKVCWYSYTNVNSSRDYIRVKSKHYNELSFSNVSINMNKKETENYN